MVTDLVAPGFVNNAKWAGYLMADSIGMVYPNCWQELGGQSNSVCLSSHCKLLPSFLICQKLYFRPPCALSNVP